MCEQTIVCYLHFHIYIRKRESVRYFMRGTPQITIQTLRTLRTY